jgi:hypothetical protein
MRSVNSFRRKYDTADILSPEGITIDPEKLKAVTGMVEPEE